MIVCMAESGKVKLGHANREKEGKRVTWKAAKDFALQPVICVKLDASSDDY